jgi:hypothetical protein
MVSSVLLAQTEEGQERLIAIKGIETPAYILGALTAGGGTFGYVKTGSIPSVAAGVTVGALVIYTFSAYKPSKSNRDIVSRWRLSNPKQADLGC